MNIGDKKVVIVASTTSESPFIPADDDDLILNVLELECRSDKAGNVTNVQVSDHTLLHRHSFARIVQGRSSLYNETKLRQKKHRNGITPLDRS